MENSKEIRVPALIENGRVLVPEYYLGKEIKYKFDKRGNPISTMMYTIGVLTPNEIEEWINDIEYKVPTLSELSNAYFGKNPNGSWLSPEFRESIKKQASAEWSSSYLAGSLLIENPKKFKFNKKNKIWLPVDGTEKRVTLPKKGWVIEYDKETGIPKETSSYDDAKKVFGEDASYFEFKPGPVRSIVVTHSGDFGPFGIIATRSPEEGHKLIGARNCRKIR